MRIFLIVVALLSCLIGSAGLWVCQQAGWRSDGPGLLCPMIVMAGGYLVAAISLFSALGSAPSKPPII